MKTSVDEISEDLNELLHLSKFLINRSSFKKERKTIRKMIKKINDHEFESLLSDGSDYNDV